MSKISGQLLIFGQFQDVCDISGQLGALHALTALNDVMTAIFVFQIKNPTLSIDAYLHEERSYQIPTHKIGIWNEEPRTFSNSIGPTTTK